MALKKPWNRSGIRSWLLTVGLLATLAGHASTLTLLCGTILVLASIPIQFWSKGCLRQNKEVTWSGPFRFVRHPFYLANFVLDAGLVLMSGYWLLILLFPFWWLVVYIPVMRREEETLIGLFGDEYRSYMACVPMLFPYGVRPHRRIEAGFDWKSHNIIHTEIPRAMKYLVYPLMYALANRVSETELHIFTSPTLTDLLIVATIVIIMATRAIWMRRVDQ